MLTYQGKELGKRGKFLWKTGETIDEKDPQVFFGVECDGKHVGIYQGTPENVVGDAIWKEPTEAGVMLTDEEKEEETTTTVQPTAAPTKEKTTTTTTEGSDTTTTTDVEVTTPGTPTEAAAPTTQGMNEAVQWEVPKLHLVEIPVAPKATTSAATTTTEEAILEDLNDANDAASAEPLTTTTTEDATLEELNDANEAASAEPLNPTVTSAGPIEQATVTTAESSICTYDLGLREKTIIPSGYVYQSPDRSDIFLEQMVNGNLVVREGDTVIWETKASKENVNTFTRLQAVGNMVTYQGNLEKFSRLWHTGVASRDPTTFFFGLACDGSHVGIYEGTPDDPGKLIWREPTIPGSISAVESEIHMVEPLSMYAMGDVPYNDEERQILVSQLQEMKQNLSPNASFLVHVGDWQKPYRTNCSPTHFASIANLFREESPLPSYVLAGDNDYLDCKDPNVAWEQYLENFVGLEQDFKDSIPAGVPHPDAKRWEDRRWIEGGYDAKRKEMFSFVQSDVLFLSVTLLNMGMKVENDPTKGRAKPDNLFYERLAVSKAWLKKNLEDYSDRKLRGIVMFGHAMISDDLKPFFGDEVRKVVFDQGLGDAPFMYVCGDGHEFAIGKGLPGWSQFTRVMVDNGAAADPLRIDIAPVIDGRTYALNVDGNSGSEQFILGHGLFRIDRQKGRYKDAEPATEGRLGG